MTYRAIRILGKGLPADGVLISEIDAIYYMVSSVFGFERTFVTCIHCGWAHLDKDWFSVYRHRRHLCAGCGKHFHDRVTGIGNRIVGVRTACGEAEHEVKPAAQTLNIKQSEYAGGLQIWGSNPAFLWTQPNGRVGVDRVEQLRRLRLEKKRELPGLSGTKLTVPGIGD